MAIHFWDFKYQRIEARVYTESSVGEILDTLAKMKSEQEAWYGPDKGNDSGKLVTFHSLASQKEEGFSIGFNGITEGTGYDMNQETN